MMTQYPYGIGGRHLAGLEEKLVDPIADKIATQFNQILQGGPEGSPQRKNQTEFFSDVLSLTGQKFVASEKGKKAVDDAVRGAAYGVVVPLALVAFVAGYLLGKKKGG